MTFTIRVAFIVALLFLLIQADRSEAQPSITRAKIGISLGSHAVITNLRENRFITDSTLSLVEPGTAFIIFDNEAIMFNNQRLSLALSELGIWLYIPTDPSTLITQEVALRLLHDRLLSGKEWKIFTQRITALNSNCVIFTPGEISSTESYDDKSINIQIFRDSPITNDKFRNILSTCPDSKAALSENGDTLNFRIPESEGRFIVDATSFLYNALYNYGANLDSEKLRKDTTANTQIFKLIRNLYRDWPQLLITNEVSTFFDCNSKSIEIGSDKENQIVKKISSSISAKMSFLGLEVGGDLTNTDKLSTHLKQTINTGTSISETTAIYIEKTTHSYVSFSQVAKCYKPDQNIEYMAQTPPFWYRMHWEGKSPFVIDIPQYQDAVKSGLKWDNGKGTFELKCFADDYFKLREILEKQATPIQARVFLAYYARTPKGQWKAFWSCRGDSK